LVGVGSLVVSFFTYLIASDTSQTNKAIASLSTLAQSAQIQAKAAQDQLTELRDEQRPWLAVSVRLSGNITITNGKIIIPTEISVTNTGHEPAFQVVELPEVSPVNAENFARIPQRVQYVKATTELLIHRGLGTVVFPGETKNFFRDPEIPITDDPGPSHYLNFIYCVTYKVGTQFGHTVYFGRLGKSAGTGNANEMVGFYALPNSTVAPNHVLLLDDGAQQTAD